jgi:predicted dehydrogenase
MLERWNREGKFGKLYHIYCSFRGYRDIPGLGGAFTTKAQSGGGVLIDWGVHFFDLVFYILGGVKVKTVSCDAYCELAKDMKAYRYDSMWAEDTADIENGTNDVDDFISGYVRTDKANISFNGAWAQNIGIPEMYVDFLGDKGGARLEYGKRFTFWDGETLQSFSPKSDLPNQWAREDIAFIEAIKMGKKTKNNIDEVLETMKLLEALYQSGEQKKEITY